MCKDKPSVSIIMATFNSSLYLLETVQSIINQSYEDWELLITDDCSTDDTYEHLLKLAKQHENIYVMKNSVNSGAAVARNNSIDKSKGRYIAFLDSDDLWYPEKLKHHLSFIEQNSAALSFTSYALINEHSEPLDKVVDKEDLGWINYEDLLRKKATLGCSTVVVDRKKIGDFKMPSLRTGQDYATWLQLIKISGAALHYPKVLTSYRITPGSISRNKIKKAKRQWQIYRVQERLNVFKATICFCYYAFRAVFRR
ncbi:MAG: glycosyltransferase [Thalassotalea sp.]|nr:glycosyltransferase [Thalassotalea sp.]